MSHMPASAVSVAARLAHVMRWIATTTALWVILPLPLAAGDAEPLRLVRTIPLPNVEGRIDHMAYDAKRGRLFIAALGNNTVEVIDLKAGKHLRSLPGFHEPQGIACAPELGRVFVANGENGACDMLDAGSLKRIGSVHLGSDADNVRYDARAKRVYVGYGAGAIGIIDPASGKEIGRIPLAGHPESFQLVRTSAWIYVNVPAASELALLDREKRTTLATWPISSAGSNFPMALDEGHRRVFLGCRSPMRLLVYNAGNAMLLTHVDIGGDTDDVFYDAARKRIYVSCGAGLINVIQQIDPDHYRPVAALLTAPGARTSLFVPELGELCLAVPHRGRQRAELRIYAAQP